jgi:heme/copper-type cytochrome/quinol oxidase subunit 4
MVERIGSQNPTTTSEAPDRLPQRSVIKTWLILFIGSVIVCWIAQEVVAALSITVPFAAVLVFHGIFIAAVLVIYPFMIMRNNRQTSLEAL